MIESVETIADLINSKRFAFAEEIRNRQRQETKNQIKLNF